MDLKNLALFAVLACLAGGLAAAEDGNPDAVVDNENVTLDFVAEAINAAGGNVTNSYSPEYGPTSINFTDEYGNKYLAIPTGSGVDVFSESRPLLDNLSSQDLCELNGQILEATRGASYNYAVTFNMLPGDPSRPAILYARSRYLLDGTNSKQSLIWYFEALMVDVRYHYGQSEAMVKHFGPIN
jgi:hypothetical protein